MEDTRKIQLLSANSSVPTTLDWDDHYLQIQERIEDSKRIDEEMEILLKEIQFISNSHDYELDNPLSQERQREIFVPFLNDSNMFMYIY